MIAHTICLSMNSVAVTFNFLAKRSSFNESSFVFTQAKYQKLQRTSLTEMKQKDILF